jgi:hypothetical protein
MKLVLASIFYFQLTFAFTQKHHITPTSTRITKLPFTMLTGGTIIIKAQLDNLGDTLNFVLDTGSGGISLDSTTVDYLQLPRVKTARSIRGIAGMRTVDFVYKRSLKLLGLNVDSLDFHINNYDILSSAYGVKIDGVIGYSFFRKFIVKINYDSYFIEVYKPGSIKYPSSGYMLHPDFNMLPVVSTIVSDNTVTKENFIFDTGAGLNMLLSEEYVSDSSIINKKRKQFVTQAEGLGGKKMMNATVIRKVALGPYKFRWVPVYIFNDEYNVTSYPKMGGVIGNDILRRFNLIINYPDKKIHIKPNSHFFDDFDYSYTGLGLYQIDGLIKIEDVVAGSPADKAGFKPDDIVFSVDNNFTLNMQVYKQLMQNAGNTVKIIVKRGEEFVTLSLDIQHLMH